LVVSPDSFNQAMQDVVFAAITSQGAEDGALTARSFLLMRPDSVRA
jgi:hypothetical protein